jgi:hypothetical protein
MQVMEEADHEHFILSMLFAISFVLFAIVSVFFSIPSVFFASSSVFFITSPMLSVITTLAFADSGWRTVQHKVGNWIGNLRTLFVLNSRLESLSYGHPNLLLYQIF